MNPLIELFAKEHPAFVHIPLGIVFVLPLAMGASYLRNASGVWKRTSLFLALIGVAGSLVALASGLLWGRQINLIPLTGWFPKVTSQAQVLQLVLQRHELMALLGSVLGVACAILLWRGVKSDLSPRVGAASLAFALLWAGAWGFSGRLGGIMVFGNEETNKAAAAADKAKRDDAEADLPIRALDYASLEPATEAPVRSKAHGDFWIRAWVTASGIDAYRSGKPLPSGSYVVLNTYADRGGKPGTDPGPLYMREVKGDGSSAFSFYWPRVPQARQTETGGEDSAYWRSPSPKLQNCTTCHVTAASPASTTLKAQAEKSASSHG